MKTPFNSKYHRWLRILKSKRLVILPSCVPSPLPYRNKIPFCITGYVVPLEMSEENYKMALIPSFLGLLFLTVIALLFSDKGVILASKYCCYLSNEKKKYQHFTEVRINSMKIQHDNKVEDFAWIFFHHRKRKEWRIFISKKKR